MATKAALELTPLYRTQLFSRYLPRGNLLSTPLTINGVVYTSMYYLQRNGLHDLKVDGEGRLEQ